MQTKGKVTEQLIAAIEAMLYAAEGPVSAEDLCGVIEAVAAADKSATDVDVALVHSACLELEERYRAAEAGLQVVEVARGYRLGTRPRYDAWIRGLRETERPTGLSVPLLETLAIIAYRQPATTAEISSIRGKDPASAIRRLRELGLVRIAGRRRTVGRPFTYGTTEKFLELFGLRDLNELPAPEEFQELLEG